MLTTKNLNQLKEFDHQADDFSVFAERLEQLFIAHEIGPEDPKRSAWLLTGISNDTYKLLQNLCFPQKPAEKKYTELVMLLTGQLEKKRSIFAERYKFHQLKQEEAETIQEWSARLKELVTHCKFGIGLDEALRDKFIVGLKSKDMLSRLFREPESLTFTEALAIASHMEAAKINANEIKGEVSGTMTGLHRLIKKQIGTKSEGRGNYSASYKQEQNIKERKTESQPSTRIYNDFGKKNCYTCGKAGHMTKSCKYNNYKCRTCGKTGHLMKVCKNNNSCARYWNTRENGSPPNTEVSIFNMKVNKSVPGMVEVKIDKVKLMMEIDSGSGVSAISLELYKNFFSNYSMQKSNLVFVNYNKSKDRPVGVFRPKISCNKVEFYNEIQVVAEGGPPLMGRDIMAKVGIYLAGIHKIETTRTLDMLKTAYAGVFQPGLGTYKHAIVKLRLRPDAKPVFVRPRILPFVLKDMVEKELGRLEEIGILTPVESCEWGTPLVPVVKKNGSLRLCGDYKVTLNKYLEKVKYPLPRIEELFTRLQGGNKFTKLDMSEAYSQLRLDSDSSKLATWSTHKGLFRVNRLPYGVAPAAAKFQMLMEQLLQGLEGVVNFLDDIVVTGKDEKEHLYRLEVVLHRLKEAGLKLQMNKCDFFKDQISYLGHTIDRHGLSKNRDKTASLEKAKEPSNITELRSFLGSINYYGKFVKGLAEKASPLYALLAKGAKFDWTKQCQEAFVKIKEVMCSEEMLAHYNPQLPVTLSCDASMHGIGAVLAHRYEDGSSRPIAYMAKTLSKAEKNYSMIEKEALAIFQAVKHFHQYVYGRHFTLVTDHRPLLTLFGEHKGIPAMAAGRLQRWALFLAGYDYKIEGIKGKENFGPDYLSRSIEESKEEMEESDLDNYVHFMETNRTTPIDCKAIRRETSKDITLGKVMDYINMGWPDKVSEEIKPYLVRKNELGLELQCIMWGHRVVVPESLRVQLLEELHASHLGIVKMKSTARSYMWWPKIDSQIEEVAKSCHACRLNKPEPNKAALIPWQRPQGPWIRVHVDYLGPVKGRMYLLIVDAFTKWPEVLPVEIANTSNTIDRLREVFARFGIPVQLVTDNGTQFASSQFQMFAKKNGIKHTVTAPGHPATNGQAENGVKNFKNSLYKAMADSRNAKVGMQTLIARFLLNYRSAIHSTTGDAPAKLMFGRNIRVRLSSVKPSSVEIYESKQADQQQYYKGKRATILQVGEDVMVRDYHCVNKKKWIQAKVEGILGPRMYTCRLDDGRLWRRHLDQIQRGKRDRELVIDGEQSDNWWDTEVRQENYGELQTQVGETTVEDRLQLDQVVRPKRTIKPPDRWICRS